MIPENIYKIRLKEPFFIDERESGIFYIVVDFRSMDGTEFSHYDYDQTTGKLVVGKDIIEAESKSISILLRTRESDFHMLLAIIAECRKFAELTSSKYFSIIPFGDKMGNLLKNEGDTQLVEIRPRIFKAIPGNHARP